MRKTLILGIILFVFVIILIINFIFHFVYFEIFDDKTRPPTDLEKREIIEILNQSMNLEDYQIKFGNVYGVEGRKLAQVELIKNNSRKNYLIDLKYKKVLRK